MRNRIKAKYNLFKGYKVYVGECFDAKYYKKFANMRLVEYIQSGEGYYVINGAKTYFEKGDMFFITKCYAEIQGENIHRVFIAYNKKEIIENDFDFLYRACSSKLQKKIAENEKYYYNKDVCFIGGAELE